MAITAPSCTTFAVPDLIANTACPEVPFTHENGALVDLERVARSCDGRALIEWQVCEEGDGFELGCVHSPGR